MKKEDKWSTKLFIAFELDPEETQANNLILIIVKILFASIKIILVWIIRFVHTTILYLSKDFFNLLDSLSLCLSVVLIYTW